MNVLDVVSLVILAILIVGAFGSHFGRGRDSWRVSEEATQSLGGSHQHCGMDWRPTSADLNAGVDCGVCASTDRRGIADRHQPG
jgi:hypothetical protein